jgi:hypothetical protein
MIHFKISKGHAVWLAAAGAIAGAGSAVLAFIGNPVDGGISVACFLRDMAGALGGRALLVLMGFLYREKR